MPLSVRLDEKTQSLLDETASVLQTSKTEVIKKSIAEYCSRVLRERARRPYDLIRDLVGREGSSRGDLSEKGEEILRKRFGRKR